MDLFGNKQNANKKGYGSRNERKKVRYVYLTSKKAIFIITGEVKESKYSYGVPIIPLHGYYKAEGKTYTAKQLSDYYVILNLPKDADIEGLKGKRVVILGYDKDALYIEENGEKSDDEGGE